MAPRSVLFQSGNRLPVSAPRNAVLQGLQRSATLRRELFDYGAQRIAETEQLCVCASLHSIEQRLARWLLQASALLGARPVEMTHQQFASIFGVSSYSPLFPISRIRPSILFPRAGYPWIKNVWL